jgi:hypothetical protein
VYRGGKTRPRRRRRRGRRWGRRGRPSAGPRCPRRSRRARTATPPCSSRCPWAPGTPSRPPLPSRAVPLSVIPGVLPCRRGGGGAPSDRKRRGRLGSVCLIAAPPLPRSIDLRGQRRLARAARRAVARVMSRAEGRGRLTTRPLDPGQFPDRWRSSHYNNVTWHRMVKASSE